MYGSKGKNLDKRANRVNDYRHNSGARMSNPLVHATAQLSVNDNMGKTADMGVKTSFYDKLDAVKQSQWDPFWRTCQHTHPRQNFLFGEVERAQGKTVVYAVGEIDGRIVCIGIFSISPLFLGERFCSEAECLHGPVFDDIGCAREFLLAIKSYFVAFNVTSIRLSPYWLYPEAEPVESMLNELGFTTTLSVGQPGVRFPTGLIDLTSSTDEIFSGLKSKTRQEIRRADRLGVSIRPTKSPVEASQFFEHLSNMYRQRSLDFYAVSSKEFKATFDYILRGGGFGVLLVAFYGQTFLGGFYIFRGVQTCHYVKYVVVRQPLGELANLTIAPALWWRGIQWAKEKGCRWIDVESYLQDLEPYDRRYRQHRLKKQFNPVPVQRLAAQTCVCKPTAYAIRKGYRFCKHKLNVLRGLRYQLRSRWTWYKGKYFSKDKRH